MIPSFFRLKQAPETASTNDDVKHAAEAGEAEGLVVQALRQTAGKGRWGRAWESPEGNLYASLLLRPRCPPQEAGFYTFVTALAVADTVRRFLSETSIELKWPNDVLVEGKKISGILLEAGPSAENSVEWLVIGVGINIKRHPDEGLFAATSLDAEGASRVHAGEALETFLACFFHWRGVLLAGGFAPLRDAWLAQAKKGAMTVRLSHETFEGAFAGLDEQGRLILRLPDGQERAMTVGDVFFAG